MRDAGLAPDAASAGGVAAALAGAAWAPDAAADWA
jgi:hypothetical protein